LDAVSDVVNTICRASSLSASSDGDGERTLGVYPLDGVQVSHFWFALGRHHEI